MANPKIENGSFSIANELADAIIKFEFSKRQLKILLYLMRHLYGKQKISSKLFSLKSISFATGMDMGDISRTIACLIDKNVINKKDNIYLIQQDYELWGKKACVKEEKGKEYPGLKRNEDGSYSPV